MKNDPRTMRGMKKTQLNLVPVASLVQYMMGVQPSIVTHCSHGGKTTLGKGITVNSA